MVIALPLFRYLLFSRHRARNLPSVISNPHDPPTLYKVRSSDLPKEIVPALLFNAGFQNQLFLAPRHAFSEPNQIVPEPNYRLII